ncbi:MAG: DNA-directed polymerase subunit alpha, DNA-directed polymerase subunit alpha [Candidatus Parcubacteria bacterium]|jgi:DNA-directed RNA polymerase subunit alpha
MLEPTFYTKVEDASENFARFVLEPLNPSFGQSMGNALRRTLLSSLRGAAIGYVKVEGASHFFTTIKGVKESVLDIVLNLKQLHFQVPGEGTYRMYLNVKGAGKVYGKDMEGEATVVNGDVYLGEVTDDKAKLNIEVIVESGYGFLAAEEKENTETGFTAIDSSFTPVKKVNFKVEEARVGRKSNFERLILEVTTDGSISPDNALKDSVKILASYFSHTLSGDDMPKTQDQVVIDEKKKDEANSKLDDIIIDELNLPSRVINALLRENIETVADLVKRGREKLVGLKGVGRKSIDLIDDELKKMGIELQ